MSLYTGKSDGSVSLVAGMSGLEPDVAMKQRGFVSVSQPLNPQEGDLWISADSLPTQFPVSGIKKFVNSNWINYGSYSPARFDLWTLYTSENGYVNYYWDSNANKWISLTGGSGGGASGDYLPLTGGTLTGDLKVNTKTTTKTLVIANTTSDSSLDFDRANYNYIRTSKTGGMFAFISNGKAAGTSSNAELVIQNNTVRPGANNAVSLGSSDLKWKNVHAITFNGDLSGNATSATSATTADSSSLINAIKLTNEDLNTLGVSSSGKQFYAAGANGCSNKPSGVDAFGMIVIRSADGYATQILVATNQNSRRVYTRTINGDGASASVSNWLECYSSANPQADITGNAATATNAGKLTTARTIDGVDFDGSAAIIHYGVCSTAAGTVAKEVSCTGFKLVTGAMIFVRFTTTNTGSAADLTLNVNGTGAKNIKYRNGNLSYNGVLGANRTYCFIYDGTYYQLAGDVDSNDYHKIRYQQNVKAGSNAIAKQNIIVSDSNGNYSQLKSVSSFDISHPILYANSAINANGTSTDSYLCISLTIATTQSLTLTAYRPVYIKGTLNGTTFTVQTVGSSVTQTIPTSNDGYDYLYLGRAYSTTAIYLEPHHPIYAFVGGSFTRIDGTSRRNLFVKMPYTLAKWAVGVDSEIAPQYTPTDAELKTYMTTATSECGGKTPEQFISECISNGYIMYYPSVQSLSDRVSYYSHYFTIATVGTYDLDYTRMYKYEFKGLNNSGFDFYIAWNLNEEYRWNNLLGSGGGAVACFTADTLVSTENGYEQIVNIKEGDKVYSLNEETNKIELKEVDKLVNHNVEDVYYIILENELIKSSWSHPFYAEGRGKVLAKELKAGDNLKTKDGTLREIKAINVIRNQLTTVYEIRVKDNHNYYVGKDSILVYNEESIL